jgi:hypothetical protein
LEKNSVPVVTVDFDIAGASGIVYEVFDKIAISHELLQSIFGIVYNSWVGTGGVANARLGFIVTTVAYKSKGNVVHITAEQGQN